MTRRLDVVAWAPMLVLLCCSQALAQVEFHKLEWKEYSYPDSGFAITLPDNPHPHDSSQLPHGTAYTVTLSGGTLFAIHTIPAKDNCTEALDRQASGAKQQLQSGVSEIKGFKAISLNNVEGNGFRGFEFIQKVPDGKMDYERWICAAHRLFIFVSAWSPTEKQPDEIKQIVNSFHVLANN